MAGGTPICIFSLLLFSSLSICIHGTVVGFYYDARRNAGTSSIVRPTSFLKLGKVQPSQIRILVSDPSGLPAGVSLGQAHLKELRTSQVYGASWLKTHIIRPLSAGTKINSIIISSRFTEWQSKHELHMLLSTLKSTSSLVTSIRRESPLNVSVALPLSFLQSSGVMHKKYMKRIFHVLERSRSFITIEASIDAEVSLEHSLVQLIRGKASLAASLLSRTDVPVLLIIKSEAMPCPLNLAEFGGKILRSFENETLVMAKIHGLLLEIPAEELQKKVDIDVYIPNASHRELLDDLKPVTTSHDVFNPSNPVTSPSATSADFPPYNPSPTIITVPGTNPATYPPTNPATTPVTIPSATPTNPFSSPVPATNPASPVMNPGDQPITNPVTTYPAPVGYVPIPSSPVTTVPTPVTGPPIVSGQTWCIARTGTLESALQTALDYACGIGGADCSMIQPGASCYNPNTVESHASYAFNIYFQKNPVPSSCNFGGAAVLINTNPSSGTCIYPSLVSASPVTTLPPATTIPPATATSASGTTGSSGSQPSPSVLSATNPTSSSSTIYGSESPPALNNTASGSLCPHPLIDCMILIGMFTFGKVYLF